MSSLFTIPRRRWPDLGCRSQSNLQRTTSCVNRTDEQRDIEYDNSRIGKSELHSRVIENEVDMFRMERVRASTISRVFGLCNDHK
jgi:hypothetical protein